MVENCFGISDDVLVYIIEWLDIEVNPSFCVKKKKVALRNSYLMETVIIIFFVFFPFFFLHVVRISMNLGT